MEIQKQNIISVTFLDEEVELVKSIFTKLVNEANKPGYNKLYNKTERELITKLNDEINDTVQVQ